MTVTIWSGVYPSWTQPAGAARGSDDSEVSGAFDVLYPNSTLQYLPGNSDFIALTKVASPAYVLPDDLFAASNPEVQNHHERRIPSRFLNLSILPADLEWEGYHLVGKGPFDTVVLGRSQPKPMDNFPADVRLRYSLWALFQADR